MFLCELDGYAPTGGLVRGKSTFTLAEFETKFRVFLLDVYHRHANAETKMSPLERWETNGFLPRMPDSLEHLDLLLIQVAKARQVRPDGIHFQSLRYMSITLAAYVGETVTLRFDPRDMAEIRVFHRDRFLCRAVCAELAGETVPLRELLRARNRRRRELRGLLRDRQTAVNTLLDLKRGEITEKNDEPPTPTEELAATKSPTRSQTVPERIVIAPRPSWKPLNTGGSPSSVTPAKGIATSGCVTVRRESVKRFQRVIMQIGKMFRRIGRISAGQKHC
jgi:hypothetical protein